MLTKNTEMYDVVKLTGVAKSSIATKAFYCVFSSILATSIKNRNSKVYLPLILSIRFINDVE